MLLARLVNKTPLSFGHSETPGGHFVNKIKHSFLQPIGKVFLIHMSRITYLYGGYCVHLPAAIAHLEQVEKQNANLKKQIDECQSLANPSTFPLSSHLVIPFQRYIQLRKMNMDHLLNKPYVNEVTLTDQNL